jgi:hypothetical protein
VNKKTSSIQKSKTLARSDAAKLVYSRKKAMAILNEWADEQVDVELTSGSMPIQFVGHIVRLGANRANGDFMFKSPFGESAVIFLMIYDEIIVETIASRPTRVLLGMKKLDRGRMALSPLKHFSPTHEQIAAVCDQFRIWIKLEALLIVYFGDALRTTITRCSVSEPNPGVFFFKSSESVMIHMVRPRESGAIYVDRFPERTTIMLHNRKANSHFFAADAESPEEVMEKFGLAGNFVN